MKSGEEFERLSKDVVQALNSGKKVTHNVKILGKLTEVKRQIDVKLDENEYDFVMYECKDWGKAIGVGVVGQLLTDLEDVGAKKGAIIANSPFTKGAVNLASKKGVDLLHLVKTDNPKSRIGISALVLVKETYIDAMSFGVQDTSFNAPLLSMDPDTFILFDKAEKVTIREYIKRVWNGGLNATAHLGKNTTSIDNAKIIDVRGDEYTVSNVSIDLIVAEKLYEGPWVIEEAQGLYNALENSFHAYGNMKSGVLSIEEMEKTFIEITTEKAASTPYSIVLGITSQYH